MYLLNLLLILLCLIKKTASYEKSKITIYSIIIILFGSKSHNKKYIFERSISESWEVVRGLPSVEASINYEEELLYIKFNTTFDNVNIEIKDAHNTVLVHDLVHPIENMTYTISMKGLPLNKGYKLHIHNQYGEATGLFFL